MFLTIIVYILLYLLADKYLFYRRNHLVCTLCSKIEKTRINSFDMGTFLDLECSLHGPNKMPYINEHPKGGIVYFAIRSLPKREGITLYNITLKFKMSLQFSNGRASQKMWETLCVSTLMPLQFAWSPNYFSVACKFHKAQQIQLHSSIFVHGL